MGYEGRRLRTFPLQISHIVKDGDFKLFYLICGFDSGRWIYLSLQIHSYSYNTLVSDILECEDVNVTNVDRSLCQVYKKFTLN